MSSPIFRLTGPPPFVNGYRNGYLNEFRQTASLFSARAEQPSVQAAMFASAWSGEGATTVTLGVASSLRESYGARVLTVELNFGRPAFARLFQLDSHKSWTAVARGTIAASEAFTEVEAGFSVLPAGDEPGVSRGALVRVLTQVMAAANNVFDAVLIDAPPLLETGEAMTAGKVTPRLVLVVEAGRTGSDSIQRVQRRLGQEGITLIGSVLNKEKRYIPNWIYRRLSH